MAGRVLRALVRRAADGDTEALEQLLILERQLAQAIKDAGAGLHRFGYSFTELAGVAGISRQAARERFGTRAPVAQFVDAIDEADTPTTTECATPAHDSIQTAPMGVAR
jgi:hypothetical protein